MVMTNLTIADLTEIARQFLRDEYGLALEIPIKRNNQLRRAMGRYIESYDEQGKLVPDTIEISGKMFEYGADTAIIKTLKHELVHYALSLKGEPNSDGHPHFEAEIRRVGADSSGSTYIGTAALYRCTDCGETNITATPKYVKRVANSTRGLSTNCCDAPLTYINTIICDGTKSLAETVKEATQE